MNVFDLLELCRQAAYGQSNLTEDIVEISTNEFNFAWKSEPKKIRKLLDEVLCGQQPNDGLNILMKSGMFHTLFPEISSIKDLGDAGGLHKDVWSHTKDVVTNVPNQLELRWGALLHDIGKSLTRYIAHGRVTFHNHDLKGADMFKAMQNRTNLFQDDDALFNAIHKLIALHLRPISYKTSWSDKSVKNLVIACGDSYTFEQLIMLSKADMSTKNTTKRDCMITRNHDLKTRGERIIIDMNAPQIPKLPKNTMSIIMSMTNREGGPWLNKIKIELEQLMLNNELKICDDPKFYAQKGIELLTSHNSL